MRISKKLYVDENIPYHKWCIWKLRRNKKTSNIYCVCMVDLKGHVLEIVNSNQIEKQDESSILIGIAPTRERAIKLTARIFDEIYKPNPNLGHMKDYFMKTR